MKGICCCCQDKVDIETSAIPINQMLEIGWEEEDVRREFGEPIRYICSIHEAFGQHCEGSGQCPEAILKG